MGAKVVHTYTTKVAHMRTTYWDAPRRRPMAITMALLSNFEGSGMALGGCQAMPMTLLQAARSQAQKRGQQLSPKSPCR